MPAQRTHAYFRWPGRGSAQGIRMSRISICTRRREYPTVVPGICVSHLGLRFSPGPSQLPLLPLRLLHLPLRLLHLPLRLLHLPWRLLHLLLLPQP